MTDSARSEPLNRIHFRLNGAAASAATVPRHRTLLAWLRDHGWTGAKEGCNGGDCGACAIAIDMPGPDGMPTWSSVNSCLLPLQAVSGRQILTVEGLESPLPHQRTTGQPTSLHPIQSALLRHHGSQCGYCTPGIVMSLVDACQRRNLDTRESLDAHLAGNLCRCTGYRSIREAAVEALTSAREGPGIPPPTPMDPCPAVAEDDFGRTFHRPKNLASLFALHKRFPDSQLIAGGTDLVPRWNQESGHIGTLISLEGVRELGELQETPTAWHLGSVVPLSVLAERLLGEFPAWDEMLRWFGSRQIRNRATLGGNLAGGSPVADASPVLMALGARLILSSAAGERILPLDDFFAGYRKTVLRRGEILRSVIVPRRDGFRSAFYKVSRRREVDITTVSAAFALKLGPGNLVEGIRIACGGVAPTPMRAFQTEAALLGRRWDAATIAQARPTLEAEFTPISDVRGSREYRVRVLGGLLERFLEGDHDEGDRTPLPSPASPPQGDPHDSAHLHVTGRARFVDDAPQGMLETWPVLSPHAHARLRDRDATAARRMPGVVAVLFAGDVPGLNDVGPVRQDEPLLAETEVHYHGQPVALVVAETRELARTAAGAVTVGYEPLPAITDLRTAIAESSLHTPPKTLRRGDVEAAMAAAPYRISGDVEIGGQDHFYLETQACWAEPGDDGTLFLNSSTQHPSEVQAVVARVLGRPLNRVVVQSPRLGGGFGGKETQAAAPAALAALAAVHTGRPVRVRYSREQDMVITGKRHPFLARFEAGHDEDGRVLAVRAELYANGGWALDLSRSIADRALLHLDNAYFLPAVEFQSTVVRTHLTSQTAFRGFGGPQGMLVIEEILDRIARRTGLRPEIVRERNLYHGAGESNTTHYGQLIADHRIQRVWNELKATSDFEARRAGVVEWNRTRRHRRRGIAITPVKFGISFTVSLLNQAGALVLIYRDGTVQVNHGGTEMGQGIHSNILRIAAQELEIPRDGIRIMPTRTDKVPNTSATAASCSTDLNGMAVQQACAILRERLAPFRTPGRPFSESVEAAYAARVSLSATGYYRTPGLSMDWETGRGNPFHYFSVGAAVTEVEVDGRTGMTRVLRVDLLHDAGNPVNPAVCRGQIEGGFIQGLGWLTSEELVWDAAGRLLTHSPDTYKIPTLGDTPDDFRVALLENATQPGTIQGSKAVGEPPFMLALSAREAIRDAVAAFRGSGEIPLASPATPEAILRAIHQESQPVPVPMATTSGTLDERTT